MNYKSYADLSYDILKNLYKVPKDIQLIVGVPRSGMVPAYMIGTHLNLPVATVNQFLDSKPLEHGNRLLNLSKKPINNILIVDDSIYSGKSITRVKDNFKSILNRYSIYYCAIYASNQTHSEIDFYFEVIHPPRVFQWNYKNHYIATESCYDIDGVLCKDPEEWQNDDGVNYKNFLVNAEPLFLPKYEISCLVTSRLSKYRVETELWLKNNNVKYKELVMLDLDSADERRRLNVHGKFKAKIFEKRKEQYFFESSWRQAKEIFILTNKPVFCIENDILINSQFEIDKHDGINKNKTIFSELMGNGKFRILKRIAKNLFR